jgi:hypothetical protein
MGTLNGDGPCADCGTIENIIWHTANVFWNAVCQPDNPILCVRCFVARVEAVGYKPQGWVLEPDWPWVGEVNEEHEKKFAEWHKRWVRGEVD